MVNQILNHPTINSPIPDNTLFTDNDAFRLYFQYHESVTELARITLRLKRASRLLQFVPGPPGHQGSYRVNPSTHFPPDTTDFLADEVLDTTVLAPIAIVSCRLLARQPETAQGPETAQHPSRPVQLQ